MEDNWYKTSDTHSADWYTAARAEEAARTVSEPVKKRRSFKWPIILTTLVLMLGATIFALGSKDQSPAIAPEATVTPSPMPNPDDGFAFDWSFGGAGSEDGEGGFADDFEEFFKNYYTGFENAEECNIPKVQARKGLSIELEKTHGEALTLQELYQKCSPFIVALSAYETESTSSYSFGTGVLFTSDGYIVTNSHIIEGSIRCTVTLWDDCEYEAKLVGNDSRSDIAILKIDGTNLPCCSFADTEGLQVGDEVVAIGNPLASTFRSTMTNGIITGIDRDVSYNGATLTLLQTNAALNSGNSGGALINRYGQVIGITNMKMSNNYSSVTIEGVGFAIPSPTVKAMADSLLQNGEVLGRPALGITVGAIPDEAAEHYSLPSGLYVSEVRQGSDALRKGIQVGDVITQVNGKAVAVTSDVTAVIATMQVGDSLHMTIFRSDKQGGGETIELDVELVDVNEVY